MENPSKHELRRRSIRRGSSKDEFRRRSIRRGSSKKVDLDMSGLDLNFNPMGEEEEEEATVDMASDRSLKAATFLQNQHLLRFDAHHSLQRPSSSVTFRGESIQVFEFHASQVQMKISNPDDHLNNNDEVGNANNEAFNDPYYSPLIVEVKEVQHDCVEHISALRLIYTIVALFCMVTFFCFCVLVILFLFMDMVSDAGMTGEKINNIGRVLGTMSAIPIFLNGISSLLTIWGVFISETWHGFPFLRTIVTDRYEVLIELTSLTIMLGAPLVTLIINMALLNTESWWENTIYVSYVSVSTYFAAFAIIVVYCETEAAWLIVQQDAKCDDGNDKFSPRSRAWSKIKHFLTQAIMRTQDRVYCGYKEKQQTMNNITDDTGVVNGFEDPKDESKLLVQSHNLFWRWYTKMSQWGCLSLFFERIDPPEKLVSIDDIFPRRRFITRNNWSIENSVCLGSTKQNVVVVKGPGALEGSQIISTVMISGISILGLLLVVFNGLRMSNVSLSLLIILVVILVIGIACFPNIIVMRRFLRIYQKYRNKKNGFEDSAGDDCDNADDDIFAGSFEIHRVSRPTQTLRIVFLVLHYGLLYLLPITTLILLENYPVLIIFLIFATWSSVRYWFNPVNMLKYRRNFERVQRRENNMLSQKWKDQSHLSAILLNATRARKTKTNIWAFLIIIIGILSLAMGSLVHHQRGFVNDEATPTFRFTPKDNFVYPPKKNRLYPACRFMNDVNILNSTETTLIDYTFLSNMVYQDPKIQQDNLNEWFGSGVGKFDSNITRDFKKKFKIPDLAVSYDIVSFGDKDSVIVVRGSHTTWEWLSSTQLWTAVFILEAFQSVLPAGTLFSPILNDVLQAMEWIESKSLKDFQLDSQTTGLVNYMRDTAGYNGPISITGHSLGGGVALITGVQTKIPAIAISGPFSRKTFDPVLDLDAVNSMIFNVIPDRDVIPWLDNEGLLTQHVACRAKDNGGCHDPFRTLCELMVTCGSFGRPPPCRCAVLYGYEEPQQVSGDQSFSKVCGTRQSNDGR